MRKYFQLFLFVLCVSAQSQIQFHSPLEEHLALGNPSAAVVDISVGSNYLMIKPQYVLSYSRFAGIPNWVAWHVDSIWLGEMHRSNNFRADSTLPEKWYHVTESSYRRSGYDRGHMCPSGDRTNTQENNSATFLMTNMIPQVANNNRGPWATLEIYCRDLVKQGKELYIYSGGYGSKGFLDSGRVNIPERTWKVIVVLDAGNNDLQRVTTSTRTIAVDMPNDNSLIRNHDDWKIFRTTIDAIEKKTGFNFLSKVSNSIQATIEAKVDTQ